MNMLTNFRMKNLNMSFDDAELVILDLLLTEYLHLSFSSGYHSQQSFKSQLDV